MQHSEYSDSSFWDKVKKFALTAGKEVIEKALWLYYAAQRPETPKWAKTAIYGALAYFISPIDAIPDITPLVGFTDDLGALAAAIAMGDGANDLPMMSISGLSVAYRAKPKVQEQAMMTLNFVGLDGLAVVLST